MAIIVALALVCAWLAMKLLSANKDIADLRARVESMRRKLLRLR